MNVNDATWRWMTDEEYAAVRGGVLQHVSREELCGLDDRGTVDLALRDPRLHEEQGLTLSELCSYIARARDEALQEQVLQEQEFVHPERFAEDGS